MLDLPLWTHSGELNVPETSGLYSDNLQCSTGLPCRPCMKKFSKPRAALTAPCCRMNLSDLNIFDCGKVSLVIVKPVKTSIAGAYIFLTINFIRLFRLASDSTVAGVTLPEGFLRLPPSDQTTVSGILHATYLLPSLHGIIGQQPLVFDIETDTEVDATIHSVTITT